MQGPATDTGAPALEPLAIVGAGCRLPGGVHTPDDYWALLCEGRDLWQSKLLLPHLLRDPQDHSGQFR